MSICLDWTSLRGKPSGLVLSWSAGGVASCDGSGRGEERCSGSTVWLWIALSSGGARERAFSGGHVVRAEVGSGGGESIRVS